MARSSRSAPDSAVACRRKAWEEDLRRCGTARSDAGRRDSGKDRWRAKRLTSPGGYVDANDEPDRFCTLDRSLPQYPRRFLIVYSNLLSLSFPKLIPLIRARPGHLFASNQRSAFHDGAGVRRENAFGKFFPTARDHGLAGLGQARTAVYWVVSIAGDDVDQSAVEEPVAGGFRRRSESAGDGHGGDLEETAERDPFFGADEVLSKDRITLRVGDDGNDTGVDHAAQDFLGVLANVEVGAFDQEVLLAIDGVLAQVLHQVVHVIEAEMEFASEVDFGNARSLIERLNSLEYDFALEGVFGISVRGSDDIGGAVGGGDFEHSEAHFHAGGAVIDAPYHVAVDVSQKAPPRCWVN